MAHGNGHRAHEEPTGDLTLDDALALALRHSPALSACAHEVAAADARALQAGLWRNPEIGLRRDRLGSGGGTDDDARSRIILSQRVETGRAPARRRALACIESELVAWDCEAERLSVAAETIQSFAATAGAQEKLFHLREARDFVREIQRGVGERAASGELPERRVHQMVRHASAAEIALRRAESDLAAARQRLAATWGGCRPRFGALLGGLDEPPAPPDSAALMEAVERSPAVARWRSGIARADARARLAAAEAWLPVQLEAGVRLRDDSSERTYLLGMELPLPLFDRGQGSRRSARHELAAAEAGQAAARAEAAVEASAAYQELAAARFEALALRNEVIPAAAAEFAALRQGFAEGVVSVADLLDAAGDLTRARIDYIDALVACRQALARIEELTGMPLSVPSGSR
ncbi:MAG: TolC family protein [Candidatus Eisenbacteria bacterium]|uniref:TolC family protein n=1 Tax=Eiseniibacteriota bacterium TaxID=2212470 RepID=A0A937XA01_UNCEI|nr:TolC family protein [Candidatus Eisenbacteria bacterium]